MIRKFFLLISIFPLFASAQTLTLGECLESARENYPALKQYGLIEQTREYNLSNAAKGWLPQISASAGAYAFTDIVDGSRLEKMGMDMKNYIVNGSVTISQNIYDGGQIAAKRKVARAQAEADMRQNDVTMYALNERVEQMFFGIMMLDEQIAQCRLLQDDLGISLRSVESMVKGGIANQSDIDAVKVEMVKAQQQQGALESSRKAYIKMLGIFIGKELGENVVLQKPDATAYGEWSEESVMRPELNYYTAQTQLIDAQRKQLNARLLPTVSAFGMGMLHSSVTDLVNNSMLMGGISVNWNIGALYTRKNDLRKLETQRKSIETQRKTFLFNNRLQNENTNGAIESLRKQIAQDDEIVRLRESIRSKSQRRVELGTENVNEMLRDINAVSMARQQKALHEIQMIKEIYSLKNNRNN